MENNLPKGWEEVELSFLVDYKKGKKPKRMENKTFKNSLVYLDIRAIEKKNDEIFVDAETSNATDESELIVVWDGARAGWVGKSRRGALGSTLMGLKPKIDRDYLYRFIQTQFDYLQTNHRGTGIPHVDPDIFWNIKVPVAPEKEQQRIVGKLDELMEKIDRSRARLERIPKILKRFRQSILSAAVSGKLTEEWRERNNVTEDWEETSLRSALELLDQGWSPKCENFASQSEAHWGVIKTTAVQHMEFVEHENKQLPKHLTPEKQFEVKVDDILITRAGPRIRVGVCCHVKKTRAHLMICDKVYRMRTNKKKALPGFIEILLNTYERIEEIEGMKTGISDSGVNLTQGKVKSISFLLPLIDEQRVIVKKVEELFLIANTIEARYNKAKAQLDKLPQSLLTKAFRGELVPQDENDEPAAILLEKIKATKPVIHSKKRKTKNYSFEPIINLEVAAEPDHAYSKSEIITIPENKKAFAKQVLGGKIVSLFKDDPHFTHIKFQKLQYLAEHLAEVDLNWNYYRQSAGPYDPKFMHSVALKLKASKWFEERKYKFYPLEKADKIEGYYQGYFKPVAPKLDPLFTALKNATEDEAEIVATLYAVWNNMIIKKEGLTIEVILSTFFEWSDRKKKYTKPQVSKALAWMKKNGLVPTGFGRIIKEKKKVTDK